MCPRREQLIQLWLLASCQTAVRSKNSSLLFDKLSCCLGSSQYSSCSAKHFWPVETESSLFFTGASDSLVLSSSLDLRAGLRLQLVQQVSIWRARFFQQCSTKACTFRQARARGRVLPPKTERGIPVSTLTLNVLYTHGQIAKFPHE